MSDLGVHLSTYIKEDLRRLFLASMISSIASANANGCNVEYLRGVIDTNHAHALAVGLDWCEMVAQVKRELGTGQDLLSQMLVLDGGEQ